MSAGDRAAAARDSEFAALETSLQERLDPIDWATYEAYLWKNEATCYQRCSVLFGALFQLNWLHGQVLGSSSPLSRFFGDSLHAPLARPASGTFMKVAVLHNLLETRHFTYRQGSLPETKGNTQRLRLSCCTSAHGFHPCGQLYLIGQVRKQV